MSKFKDFSFEPKKSKSTLKSIRPVDKKERMTYWLAPDLIDTVQAYAHWTPGATISSTVEQALTEFFARKRVKPLPPELQKKRDEAKAKKMT